MPFSRSYVALILCVLYSSSVLAATQVALTIDDLPRHGAIPAGVTRLQIARQILDTLEKHHLQGVYGFLNGKKIDETEGGAEILHEWVRRGQFLGNHSYSHADLNKTNLKDYEQDIKKNEAALADYFPHGDYKWFRYPFLDEGMTLKKRGHVHSFLEKHGYKIAQVSVTFGDWNWQDPYARCADKADGRMVKKLKDSYIKSALSALQYNRQLSDQLFEREIQFVLLVHVGAFTASMLDTLLTTYEKAGVEFVSLESATQDDAYRIDPQYFGEWSGAFLDQIRKARNLPKPDVDRPDISGLEKMCR